LYTSTLLGAAKATIANSIANSNRLRSDMIGILPKTRFGLPT
jgi:hypothetical protein